ncbi:helix-turn-helix domain-containing protein [uncultured Desulfosarcina sp.]
MEKGIKILEFLSEQGPLTVSEVGVLLSIQRSTSHRFFSYFKGFGICGEE